MKTIAHEFFWLTTLIAVLVCGNAMAGDPDSGGFVTQSQGAIAYVDGVGKTRPLPAFAQLPSGTRVTLDETAKLQIVYLRSGRQESWTGKAAIQVGDDSSLPVGQGAAPSVKQLPPFMVDALVKSHAVMGSIHERQGMIRVRSLMTAPQVRKAEERYAELRKHAAEDDITPEIYLLTTLNELKAYESMKKALAEMLRRQPDNADAKALYDQFLLLLSSGAVDSAVAEHPAE